MREILFRGKRTDNGEWVEGYYYKAKYCRTDDELCDYITVPHPKEYNEPSSHYIVNPDTVGQYTGVTDKNGERIFEGDIVKYKEACKFGDNDEMEEAEEQYLCTNIVEFKNGRFFPLPQRCDCEDYFFSYGSYDFEVVGNVHDNPELLRGNNNG